MQHSQHKASKPAEAYHYDDSASGKPARTADDKPAFAAPFLEGMTLSEQIVN